MRVQGSRCFGLIFAVLAFITMEAYSEEKPRELICKLVGQEALFPTYEFIIPGKVEPSSAVFYMMRMDGGYTTQPLNIRRDGGLAFKNSTYNMTFRCGYSEKFVVGVAVKNWWGKETIIAMSEVVPLPIEAVDESGHKITLVASNPNGEDFLIKGTGFLPWEKIKTRSRSCDEVIEDSFLADPDGTFHVRLLPAVLGKREGPFEVVYTPESGKPLTIRHYWGRIAFTWPDDYDALKEKYKFPDE